MSPCSATVLGIGTAAVIVFGLVLRVYVNYVSLTIML